MKKNKKNICIVGLGFVGSAMMLSIANSKKINQNVIGIEVPNDKGLEIVKKLNAGIFPIKTEDKKLIKLCSRLAKYKKYECTTELSFLSSAEIILIDINLDILNIEKKDPHVDFKNFQDNIKKIVDYSNPKSLYILQTTVPPGTTEKFVKPVIHQHLLKNNININNIRLAYSFERVMPGKNYLNSIINNWRVVGGINDKSTKDAVIFFKKFINYKNFPISILPNITSTEMAKVIENSYRAVNIAFIEEWSRLSESLNIDIYKIINSIKIRPTHNNLSRPGFGVGGYCLTKDPLFGKITSKYIINKKLDFPFSEKAIQINRKMPFETLKLIKQNIDKIRKKKIAIFGISYKEDVGDLRQSPSIFLAKRLKQMQAHLVGFDPFINNIDLFDKIYNTDLPNFKNLDVIILAVPHKIIINLRYDKLIKRKTLLIDSFNILTDKMKDKLLKKGIKIISIGKGNG